MIEFRGEDGGRHLYNEDMLDLQDLALSFTQIYTECGGDFVIHGCDVERQSNGWYVGDGLVWLDGKIRKVEKTQVPSQYPLYIVPKNTLGNQIPYAIQGITGSQYMDYGVSIQATKPSSGRYVSMRSREYGFEDLRSAFINYYALTSGVGKQEVNSDVSFTGLTIQNKRFGDSQNYAEVSSDENGLILNVKFVENGLVKKTFSLCTGPYSLDVFNSSGKLIHTFQSLAFGDDEVVSTIFPILHAVIVNADIFKTLVLKLNGYHTDSWFFVKEDTGWLRVERNMGMIYCRQIHRDVYITGRLTLTDDDFLSSEDKGGYWLRKTVFRLPQVITPPSFDYIFNVRGGTLQNNGSTNWRIGSDRYFYVESDENMLMRPTPSSFNWHYYL